MNPSSPLGSTPATSDTTPVFAGRSPSQLTVGFVGLGVMGQGMAKCLLSKGHRLVVTARRPEVLDAFHAIGAEVAADGAALAAACDLVFTCLPRAVDVQAVLFDDVHGFARHLKPGSCVIDTSTIAPGSAREIGLGLRRHGVHFLDAPISGGQAGAEQGTLSCMVGGAPEVFAACLPFISAFASNVFHTGAQGAGQAVKLCNQLCVTGAMMGVSEALLVARTQGVDPHLMRQVLMTSTAKSTVLERHALRAIDEAFTPGFRASLMLKDLGLAADTAASVNARLPVAAVAMQLLQAMCESDQGGLDWSAIAKQLGAWATAGGGATAVSGEDSSRRT